MGDLDDVADSSGYVCEECRFEGDQDKFFPDKAGLGVPPKCPQCKSGKLRIKTLKVLL